MQSLSRAILGSAGGLFITTGLALAMVAMIKVEFEAQSKEHIVIDAINPNVDIEEPNLILSEPVKLREIEVPPPAPKINNRDVSLPTQGPAGGDIMIPKIDPPKIKIERASFTIPDRTAEPILRVSPQMPGRAEKSGHCKMRFNVNAQGAPYNVQAISCSQSLFERSSIKATQKFKYRPKIVDGVATNMTGVETLIQYQLSDSSGRMIPE